MPEANPLNSPGARSHCRCGTTMLVDFPPSFVTTYRCHHCGTSPTLRRWDGPVYHGDNHWLWMGERAGYSGKHAYMQRNHHKSGTCETCGGTGKTHWANLDHRYRRVREDWAELCPSCHKTHDLELARHTVVRSA